MVYGLSTAARILRPRIAVPETAAPGAPTSLRAGRLQTVPPCMTQDSTEVVRKFNNLIRSNAGYFQVSLTL